MKLSSQEKFSGEPDPDAAAAVVADGEDKAATVTPAVVVSAAEAHDLALQDFLLKLPGVSTYNYRGLLRRLSCLADLAALSLGELEGILGQASGRTLHTFLHARFYAKQ